MKNIIFKILLIALACVLLIPTLAGCSGKYYYSCESISIVTTMDFEQKSTSKEMLYLMNEDISIAISPAFNPASVVVDVFEKYSAEEYLKTVAKLQEGAVIGKEGDLAYMEYEYKLDDGTAIYDISFVFKGKKNFYLAQFECYADKKDQYRDDFFAWAKTIYISNEV